MSISSNENQTAYVKETEQKGGGMGLFMVNAFIRGMRQLGYKDMAWALAELVDNAIQAGARMISVVFGPEESKNKPGQLALVDDGCGIVPDMLKYAVMWGGTEREDDRSGFGRFGFGLPSAAVSIGSRYSVYSITPGGTWWRMPVDLHKLAGSGGDVEAMIEKLVPLQERPPAWVYEGVRGLQTATSGTVVVLENLEYVKRGWKTTKAISTQLLKQFGMIYRHWMPTHQLFVDGKEVEVVDPLFEMEHGRGFNEESGGTTCRSIPVPTHAFEMDGSEGQPGIVTIRATVLPPNFQLKNPDDPIKMGAPRNEARFGPMKQNHGILVCREGRHIDTVKPPPRWTTYGIRDRNIKVEVDFSAELDGFFGITTSKQQVSLDDELWDKLIASGKNAGNLRELVTSMRVRREELRAAHNELVEREARKKDKPSKTEDAMRKSLKFTKKRKLELSERKKAKAAINLDEEIKRRSKRSGRPEEEVRCTVVEEATQKPYSVEFDAVEGAPFFLPKRLGNQQHHQQRVIINTAHPFYTRLYETADTNVRNAVEILLMAYGECELDAEDEREAFCQSFRNDWSERVKYALRELKHDVDLKEEREVEEDEKEAETEHSVAV
jgi:hypothetical protein